MDLLDKIKGSLVGGAAGDALGYKIEFSSEFEIFNTYGLSGITEYEFDFADKAKISDDTQMTLFTANGIVVSKDKEEIIPNIHRAYSDWLITQGSIKLSSYKSKFWIMDNDELYARRAPGGTCISGIKERKVGVDYLNDIINDSKGCGGIMRVAPIAFIKDMDIKDIDMLAAEASAITHCHTLGYASSSVFVHIINRIAFPVEGLENLVDIVLEARDTVCEMFKDKEHIDELREIINLSVDLVGNGEDDLINIHKIGEGWVAEETLGIAIYCALSHQDDFSKAIIAAVNHNGDSDSTGAVTGNIVGTLVGYKNIDKKWKDKLELLDTITKLSEELSSVEI